MLKYSLRGFLYGRAHGSHGRVGGTLKWVDWRLK